MPQGSSPGLDPMQAPQNTTSTPPAPNHLPHDIEGLVEYPFAWQDYWWLIALLLCFLLLVLVWWLWNRRKQPKEAQALQDPLGDLIQNWKRMTPQEPFVAKECYFQMSLSLRKSIAATSAIDAAHLTTKELSLALEKERSFRDDSKELFQDFLKRADLIKFAEAPTSLEEALKWHQKLSAECQKLLQAEKLRQQQIAELENKKENPA